MMTDMFWSKQSTTMLWDASAEISHIQRFALIQHLSIPMTKCLPFHNTPASRGGYEQCPIQHALPRLSISLDCPVVLMRLVGLILESLDLRGRSGFFGWVQVCYVWLVVLLEHNQRYQGADISGHS